MNKGTIIRTILAVALVINEGAVATGVAEFENPIVDTVYKILSFIATVVVLFFNTYYNNDYTKIAAKYTEDMRQAKLEESYEDIDELEDEENDDSEGIEE